MKLDILRNENEDVNDVFIYRNVKQLNNLGKFAELHMLTLAIEMFRNNLSIFITLKKIQNY